MNDFLLNIYFLFEETELFIEYPCTYFFKTNKINHDKFKCSEFFNNIMKAKEQIFDVNVNDLPDRKI